MVRNGYFQVIRDDSGISLMLYPPVGDGKKIDIDDIMKYLDRNMIKDYDLVTINKALTNLKEQIKIKISSTVCYPINEFMSISISRDNMSATVCFYPPSNDGQRISKEEMLGDLQYAKIIYGIDEAVLDRQVENPIYCTEYVIARGKSVREGKNAQITYLFNTDRRLKPKHNEDGSVDFHQLDNISHIKKGDILARLTPADLGDDGQDVLGNYVKPKKVTSLILKYGKNIILSEDKLEIYSDVDGHAMLEGDKVFVSNVYDVPADVDNSTGDISYEGNVVVHGNVRTGFKVQASGDIEVFGLVEGASIIAGGQIILHHGVSGKSKAIIVAKGNIVSKFIESAKVHTEGYVESDTIIQCQISAKGDVVVDGPKGSIIGGHICSTTLIKAKIIGSTMGISTDVEVGVDPALQQKNIELRKSLESKNTEYKKLSELAVVFNNKLSAGKLSKDQIMQYKKILESMNEIKANLISIQEEIEDLAAKISENVKAKIQVTRVIYPGSKLIISGEMKIINEELSHCEFVKSQGMIKMNSF